jgi:predicted phage tail protein
MSTLRTLTSRPRDSLIRVKVRAFNAKGSGEFSEVNTAGATIETEPTNLSVVSIDVPSTSNTETKVVWTALTGSARGGWNVAITQYEVYWDQATGLESGWVSLANTTALETVKSGLVGGTVYQFKVRAYNKYGEGLFTSAVSVNTSQPPDQPAAPTLEVVGAHVKISWARPFRNHREVLGYQILIATNAISGTEFIERKALCDGDAQAAVMYCLVGMHDLRTAPFGLAYDTLVRAKVLARNERGWSAESDANTVGARI